MMYTLATLLLASLSVVEATSSVEDSQAIAFTTTWPAKTGNNPLSKICVETHVNLPVYTFVVAGLQAVLMTIGDIGSPHSAHNTTCQELGFQYLAFDRKKCASDPDCKIIAAEITDVSWWSTTPGAHVAEMLGQTGGNPEVVTVLRNPALSSFPVVEAKSSAGGSQAVAFTTTWPAKTGNNPLSKICVETHVNLPFYTLVVAALQAVVMTIGDIGSPHSVHNTTCQELGFQYLAFDLKKCAADPDCKVIAAEFTDVYWWSTTPDAHATDALGKHIGNLDVVPIARSPALRQQKGHTDSRPSNIVTMV